MKALQAAAFCLSLALCGCYNLLTFNTGVANKNASALAAPLDSRAYCAALAHQGFTIHKAAGDVSVDDAIKICDEIITAQQAKGKKL
jgi:predicted Fe-Mo cluster-binding NifX family protein